MAEWKGRKLTVVNCDMSWMSSITAAVCAHHVSGCTHAGAGGLQGQTRTERVAAVRELRVVRGIGHSVERLLETVILDERARVVGVGLLNDAVGADSVRPARRLLGAGAGAGARLVRAVVLGDLDANDDTGDNQHYEAKDRANNL